MNAVRVLPLLAVLLVALAGCSSPAPAAGDDPQPSPSGQPAPGQPGGEACAAPCCPPDTTAAGAECVPVPFAHMLVTADAPLVVGVPFMHGELCLDAATWMAGRIELRNATLRSGEVRHGGVGGTLLLVNFTAPGEVSLWLNTSARPRCDTFRYDPWSIDPEPEEGTVTVDLKSGTGKLLVRTATAAKGERCAEVVDHAGVLSSPGWQAVHEGDRFLDCPDGAA